MIGGYKDNPVPNALTETNCFCLEEQKGAGSGILVPDVVPEPQPSLTGVVSGNKKVKLTPPHAHCPN